ncbi:uncharacterized protein [Ambystoma mexicanum]|uniref:uncharacterized protein n=1 Tax=Ambystoma mexicanum TaxID=8296 RepID=UPI0037E7B77D
MAVGPAVRDIAGELLNVETVTYGKLHAKLSEYFAPHTNVDYERHVFHTTRQEKGESIVNVVMRLRIKLKHCQFHRYSNEEALRSQVIAGCLSQPFRKQLLQKQRSLEEILALARMEAAVDSQLDNLGGSVFLGARDVRTSPARHVKRDAELLFMWGGTPPTLSQSLRLVRGAAGRAALTAVRSGENHPVLFPATSRDVTRKKRQSTTRHFII